MAKIDYIVRYLLIIKKVKDSNELGINPSMEEIIRYVNEEMEQRGMQTGFSFRTFQRDISNIKASLGLSIDYDRTKNGYYIPSDEGQISLLEETLDTFDILTSLGADNVKGIIFPEVKTRQARGREHLVKVIRACMKCHTLRFHYEKYNAPADVAESEKWVEPYAIKQHQGVWFLLGRYKGNDKVQVFGLDRISDVEDTEISFKRDTTVNIEAMYRDYFGIIREELPIEDVELSFDVSDGKYIKARPLHHSQQIIIDNEQELRVRLHLAVTRDFMMELLTRITSVTVIAPLHLRDRFRDWFLRAYERNR